MLGNFNFARPTEVLAEGQGRRRAGARARGATGRRALSSPPAIAFWFDWDWGAAEASYNRILTLNPGEAFTHGDYA